MNIIYKLLMLLDYQLKEAPKSFGQLHLAFIVIFTILTIFVCAKYKDANDKAFRKIMGVIFFIILILEVYKQIYFSFSFIDNIPKWSYQWYVFPFQFCSTPYFVLPIIIFFPDKGILGKIRRTFMYFTSTFILFAGLAVFAYPEGVFIKTLGIDLQSLTHHGLMITMGVFTTVYLRKNYKVKDFLPSLIIFSLFLIVALSINIVHHHFSNDIEPINMFFISPYQNTTLPILNKIYPLVPYPFFLAIYIIGFSFISLFIFYLQKQIIAFYYYEKKKIESSSC